MYPMKFFPIYKEIMWGGRNLVKLGKEIPADKNVAESWELSVRTYDQSVISNGKYKGIKFYDLLSENREEILGCEIIKKHPEAFPLFIKLIDANDDLSIQVHPDDRYAKLYENDSGKDETWVVLRADKDARLVCGLKEETDKNMFIKAMEQNRVEEILNYMSVESGDVINIYPGLVHGICKGIVVAEVQQNSNITYRIYDYGRKDKDGKQRELHVNKAQDVIRFEKKYPFDKIPGELVSDMGSTKITTYVNNDKYTLQKIVMDKDYNHMIDKNRFYVYMLISGEGKIEYEKGEDNINTVETFLVPACLGEYRLKGKMTLLRAFIGDETGIQNSSKNTAW